MTLAKKDHEELVPRPVQAPFAYLIGMSNPRENQLPGELRSANVG